MKIIKRNGAEVVFDIDKINMAVTKANEAVDEKVRMTPLQIERISQSVQIACEEMGRSPSVEEIQDLVEKAIMAHGAFEVAKDYITYGYTRSLLRQSNPTDDRLASPTRVGPSCSPTPEASASGSALPKPVRRRDLRPAEAAASV